MSLHTLWTTLLTTLTDQTPRPGLHPIPGTVPITLEALILPPVIYYIALLFLPPSPPPLLDTTPLILLRNTLALLAGILFFRLPLAYHIPQSIGLNYQLSLVGLYGGCRVVDVFFLGPGLFGHVPRRVRVECKGRVETPAVGKGGEKREVVGFVDTPAGKKGEEESYFPDMDTVGSAVDKASNVLGKTLDGPKQIPVWQVEIPEDGWPHSFLDRASWALELEMSMRGMGFTWTTADVRHTRKTWLPTVRNRLHSIFVHVLPVMAVCLYVIRTTYDDFLEPGGEPDCFGPSRYDTKLSFGRQLALTAALGAFLMVAFSLAHSAFAILCSPLAPSPFAFFPPLYTTRIWHVTSVRGFWSYGWHRLFARLFLVYGVWPGEWIERKLTGKSPNERADIGKVIGGFLSSAFVHSFSVRSVLGGDWSAARGEGIFFATNGLAVVLEEVVKRIVLSRRKKSGRPLTAAYDPWVGRVWWIAVLLISGRNFARGWVNAGLVREMAGR